MRRKTRFFDVDGDDDDDDADVDGLSTTMEGDGTLGDVERRNDAVAAFISPWSITSIAGTTGGAAFDFRRTRSAATSGLVMEERGQLLAIPR